MHNAPYLLSPNNIEFPDVELAQKSPDGLLAIGGDLSVSRLLAAYQHGIFPWYSEGQPILWWAPSRRAVLFPEKMKVSRSLAKIIRQQRFTVTFDKAFGHVVEACANTPRENQEGTWITQHMQSAYLELFQLGLTHSIEVWLEGKLVGGLYGLALGQVFCGESMFSHVDNASKIALAYLAQQPQYKLIDCQMATPHLMSLGAELIPRKQYMQLLQRWGQITPN